MNVRYTASYTPPTPRARPTWLPRLAAVAGAVVALVVLITATGYGVRLAWQAASRPTVRTVAPVASPPTALAVGNLSIGDIVTPDRRALYPMQAFASDTRWRLFQVVTDAGGNATDAWRLVGEYEDEAAMRQAWFERQRPRDDGAYVPMLLEVVPQSWEPTEQPKAGRPGWTYQPAEEGK